MVGAFLVAYVVVIGVPLDRAVALTPDALAATTPSNIAKSEVNTPVQSTTTSTDLKTELLVELGTDPGTLFVNFPPGTKENLVIATVGSLGLSIIRGDVGTGRYLFSLPKVNVHIERAGSDPHASDKAWINFPRIYTAADIDSYFATNHLKVERWATDPETSDRYAVVDLPRLEAKLVDPERGLYTITLVQVDEESLSAWARESGVRIIQYDDKTGEAIVQPLDWRAPGPVAPVPTAAPSAAPAQSTAPAPARTAPPMSELIPGVDRNGRAGYWSSDGTFWVPVNAPAQPSAAPTPPPASNVGGPAPKQMSLFAPPSAASAEDPSPSPSPSPEPSPSESPSPSPEPSPSESPSPSPEP
ncbi:MAG: hypothetical protein WEE03_06650, partial [Chloroflexota bacterium]